MNGPPTAPPPRAPETSTDELARLGITRVRTEHFQIGSCRYSSLAEARRARAPGSVR